MGWVRANLRDYYERRTLVSHLIKTALDTYVCHNDGRNGAQQVACLPKAAVWPRPGNGRPPPVTRAGLSHPALTPAPLSPSEKLLLETKSEDRRHFSADETSEMQLVEMNGGPPHPGGPGSLQHSWGRQPPPRPRSPLAESQSTGEAESPQDRGETGPAALGGPSQDVGVPYVPSGSGSLCTLRSRDFWAAAASNKARW